MYFYHPDHLGSSSYITDREGRITQHTEYIAFGGVLFEEHSTSKTMPYLFNGKELDSETNLTYFGARYLDMKTSLWLNTDPLSGYNPIQETEHYIDGQHNGGIYNPMNMATYSYTYQNPVIYVDPNGKQTIAPIIRLVPLLENSSIKPNPVIEATTKTGEVVNKMQENLKLGRSIEKQQLEQMGLKKNTRTFEFKDPKTGKIERTIPDAITKDGGTVEIKYVKRISLTKQIRGQIEIAKRNGAEAILRINRDAIPSRPIQNSEIKFQRYDTDLKIDNIKVNMPPLPNLFPKPEKVDWCKNNPYCT